MNKRRFLVAVLVFVALGLVGAGLQIRAEQEIRNLNAPVKLADSLKLVSLNPPSGLVVARNGVVPGPGNSVEATIEYVLASKLKARVSVFTAGEPGNPLHTGIDTPQMVSRGHGIVKVRFTVGCDGQFKAPFHIVAIRYAMSDDTTVPVTWLVEKKQAVDFNFMCRTGVPNN